MPELLELLLELVVNLVDIAGWWRFCVSLLLGAGLAALINSTVHHPKVSLGLMICVGIVSVVSGIAWEISAGS